LRWQVVGEQMPCYTSHRAVAVSFRADDLATARTIHPARHAGSVIVDQTLMARS